MTEWKWYSGSNEENFEFGPFDTKEDAINEAKSQFGGDYEFIHIVEAKINVHRMSEYCRFDDFLEIVCDEFMNSEMYHEDDDASSIFPCSLEQEKELIEALKLTVDKWQHKHDIKASTYVFTNTRNEETIKIEGDM